MHEGTATLLTFWHLVIGFVVLVFGVVAIRISLTFDLNRYLDSRKSTLRAKAKNACTHFDIEPVGDDIQVQSLFISPPGTSQYQCQRCGLTKHIQDGEVEAMAEYWLKHVDEYNKQQEKFHKILKKIGIV
jgi:hypothetical protein